MSAATQQLMTAEAFWASPGDGRGRELVRGEVVVAMPPGGVHGSTALALGALLRGWAKGGGHGAVGVEAGFILGRAPDIVRGPDIAFIATAHIPPAGIPEAFWEQAPDLAVAIVAPSETAEDVREKVCDFLAAGTPLVWVLYPRTREMLAHQPGGAIHALGADDTLADATVLPGFRCRVIVNLAADSDGERYRGATVQRIRARRFPHRQRHQVTNTRRARWRLRQLARKESRFQRDVDHCISKVLVAKARTARKALAVEELTKLRERVTVRRAQRRARHSWAFRQLRTFLTYKAAQVGVVLVAVGPRNTSRTCSVCGHCEQANRADQAHFKCLRCGYDAPADTNAAVNIAYRAARQTASCAAPTPVGGASTSPPA